MYDYGARYYDPSIGRFLSVDPLTEKYPGWGPYAYVFDNPLKFVDPDGMEGESIHEDANGNRIVEIKDGDNNVYRHNELGKDGQHIDGMISAVKQKYEEYGTSAGGEKQFVKSTINKISNFFKDGGQQQHKGDNLVIYWSGSQDGWSIIGDRPDPKGAKESIDMTKFVLPNGPSNLLLGFGTFNDQVNQAVGNVKNGMDDTKAYEKYKGDPAYDPSLKLDSITHARNNTIEHRSPKNKK